MSYLSAVDIANRALDHCGQDPISDFNESSKKARLCARVYDKVRQAELRSFGWSFAIKRAVLRPIDANTMLLQPALWAPGTTYFAGSIANDPPNQPWESKIANNLNNQPGTDAAAGTWEQYSGPLTVSLWDTTGTTAYYSGELVYTTAGDGTNRVYRSMQNANADNPATATAWSSTVTYIKNEVVTMSGVPYMSRIDNNLNLNPTTTTFADWDAGITYSAGQKVTGSDGTEYQSLAGGNLAHNPTSTVGFWTNLGILSPWTTVFVGGSGSVKWLQVGGKEFPFGVTLTPLHIMYPLGAGPDSQSTTRNAFRLPASYVRTVPQDPKAGAISYLGAVWGQPYKDWNFEGDYIVSPTNEIIILRFEQDIVDIAAIGNKNAMFCEGLAARMALEMVESLTQSIDKLKTLDALYTRAMGQAKIADGIETGSIEPPVDDYLACRN
jgi:hypothetical protein